MNINLEAMIEDNRKKIRKEITKNIKSIVLSTMGLYYKHHSFTIDTTIQTVIDQNFSNSNERFTLYVSMIDNLVAGLRICYPFVDLTGITLEWKVKHIIELIAAEYFSLPAKGLEQLKLEGKLKERRIKK